MARKKKKKLVVELDLPKDDKTLKNLYIIIFFSIILGLSSGIMWVTNSGFIPTANGEPMFTNVYCGATAQDDLGNDYSAEFSGAMKPSYQANESCAILKDDPTNLNGRKTRGRISCQKPNHLMFLVCLILLEVMW